jgi:predicted DCC family thiol-disulfide oxidoreductase YuxK
MSDLPILLVDNKNPLCSKAMSLIFKSGGYNKFKFLSIYSKESRELLLRHGIETTGKKLIILYEKGKVLTDSEAILQTTKILKGFISLIYVFSIIPKRKITLFLLDIPF